MPIYFQDNRENFSSHEKPSKNVVQVVDHVVSRVDNDVINLLYSSINELTKKNESLTKENLMLMKETSKLKIKITTITSLNNTLKKGLVKYFSPAQMKIFMGAKRVTWDFQTMKKAALIKVSCGNRKLDMLRGFFPFPSSRSVRVHLNKIPFEPGIQKFNLEVMKTQCESLELANHEKNFLIGFDCKSITPGVQEDPSSGKRIGHATIEPTEKHLKKNPEKLASNGLLFLAMGINPRIKKIVDFEFVCDSVNPKALRQKLDEIIIQTEKIGGVRVNGLCFDQGADNLALLSELGTKYSINDHKNFIPHPLDPSRRLYLFPDLVHITKNLTCALRKHRVKFSKSLVQKFNLSSSFANFDDIKKVFNAQKNNPFKIAPKLIESVIKPSHFETMRESTAYNMISDEVIYAIDSICENGSGKRNATSFFIEQLNKLQKIFNKKDGWKITQKEEYEKDIEYLTFLKDDFFPNIHFELESGAVKSVTGALISIASLIEFSRESFESGATVFHPKHCINNAVENIFSQVTLKSPKPSALDFKRSLKAIAISGFESVTRGSYNFEEQHHLDKDIDFFTMSKEYASKLSDSAEGDDFDISLDEEFLIIDIPDDLNDNLMFPRNFELLSFHNDVAKLILSSEKLLKSCTDCWNIIKLVEVDENHSTLSDDARKFFSSLEYCFRKLKEEIHLSDDNFNRVFLQNCMTTSSFDHCLNIQRYIIEKFLNHRLHAVLPSRQYHRVNKFSSKSMSK